MEICKMKESVIVKTYDKAQKPTHKRTVKELLLKSLMYQLRKKTRTRSVNKDNKG